MAKPSTNNAVAGPLTNSPVVVTNGLFATTLDFGTNAFAGETRWLGISVRTNGAATDFTPLSPVQPVLPTPYALYAPIAGTVTTTVFGGSFAGSGAGLTNLNAGTLASGTVPDACLGANVAKLDANQTFTGPNTFNNSANSFAGNGAALTGLNASQLMSGAVPAAALDNAWKLNGNTGTGPANSSLGTKDYQALELKVNDGRALRLEPGTGPPNLIGGSSANTVASGVGGAVIAGGEDHYIDTGTIDSAIGGGSGNYLYAQNSTIGGGANNAIQDNVICAIIAGGEKNINNADHATIAGGANNTIQSFGDDSVIGGGYTNIVVGGAAYATVAGGCSNTVSGDCSAVPGGYHNTASGNYSFAAGHQARALNPGTFVWADSSGGDFASQGQNQFLIRATGGVGVGKTSPATALDVAGTVTATGLNVNGNASVSGTVSASGLNVSGTAYAANFHGNGSQLTLIGNSALASDSASLKQVSGGLMNATSSGNIGIGKTPTTALDVFGTVTAGAFAGNGSKLVGVGSSALASDESSLAKVSGGGMVANAGQIGIGKTAPTSPLDVAGTVTAAGLIVNGSSALNGAVTTKDLNANGSATAKFFYGDGSGLRNIGGAGLLANTIYSVNLASDPDSLARVSGGKMVVSGGDIGIGSAFLGIGTTSPSTALDVIGDARVSAVSWSGLGTGTTEKPAYGLVVRRITSTSSDAGQVVALVRSTHNNGNITLERDGTTGGFLIRYPSSPGSITVASMGMDSNGGQKNFYRNVDDPAAGGTVQIYGDSQKVVYFQCVFGDTFDNLHNTQVTLSRWAGDLYWVGTLMSTSNQ